MEGEVIFYLIAGFFVGVFLVFKAFSVLKRKNYVENTPTSKVRSVAMGLTELKGEAVSSEVFKSPLTGTDCLLYRFKVEEYRSRGKSGYWAILDTNMQGDYFYLRDDTGTILLDAKKANLKIRPYFRKGRGVFKKDPFIEEYLKKYPETGKTFLGRRRLRFTEILVRPHQHIYVLGTAMDNPFVADGNQGDVMISQGKNDKEFYISDKTEKEILRTLKWKIIGFFVGGAALILGCASLLLVVWR